MWVLDDGVWRLGLITRQVGHSAAQRGRTRAVWRGGLVLLSCAAPPSRCCPPVVGGWGVGRQREQRVACRRISCALTSALGSQDATSEGEVRVQLPDGTLRAVARADTYEPNATKQDMVSDLANLDNLHEPGLMHVFRQRFFDGRYCALVGSILVSINPYSGTSSRPCSAATCCPPMALQYRATTFAHPRSLSGIRCRPDFVPGPPHVKRRVHVWCAGTQIHPHSMATPERMREYLRRGPSSTTTILGRFQAPSQTRTRPSAC